MRWRKRDMWKVGIALAGMLLLLVLMVWLPLSASAYEGTSGLAIAGTVTVQATPTENSTIAAETANEQLLKLQRDNDRSFSAWVWNYGATLISSLALALAAALAIIRYFGDRDAEREKRAEERFQAVCVGLGGEREEARAGAAIVLRTFLRPGYEQFYTQCFDLAVAHLRLRKADPNTPEPLDSLSQALIVVLKESFPLARRRLTTQKSGFAPELLDASRIHLDNAYLSLSRTDLRKIYMRSASLRGTHFYNTHLEEANLKHSDLTSAMLEGVYLEGADLGMTVLKGARMKGAHLRGALFRGADLTDANLTEADLTDTQPEGAKSLNHTIMRSVIGLSQAQKDACAAAGAII